MTDDTPTAKLMISLIFVTGLITSQVTAAKVVAIDLPFSIPLTGDLITVPAAVFAYAVTYFSSDCYAELYGKRAVQRLVNTAFVMNFVFLTLVGLAVVNHFEGLGIGRRRSQLQDAVRGLKNQRLES
jgi:hypothetical protein